MVEEEEEEITTTMQSSVAMKQSTTVQSSTAMQQSCTGGQGKCFFPVNKVEDEEEKGRRRRIRRW